MCVREVALHFLAPSFYPHISIIQTLNFFPIPFIIWYFFSFLHSTFAAWYVYLFGRLGGMSCPRVYWWVEGRLVVRSTGSGAGASTRLLAADGKWSCSLSHGGSSYSLSFPWPPFLLSVSPVGTPLTLSLISLPPHALPSTSCPTPDIHPPPFPQLGARTLGNR